MHLDKPVLKELNLSEEQKKEIERIVTSKKMYRTQKKDEEKSRPGNKNTA